MVAMAAPSPPRVCITAVPRLNQLSVVMPLFGFRKGGIVPDDVDVLSVSSPRSWLRKPRKCTARAPNFVQAKSRHNLSDAKSSYGNHMNIRHNSIRATVQSGNHLPEPSRQYIVLDIEGTTTPISFVTDALFPYARDNVRKHLSLTYSSEETKKDIKLLRDQVEDDLKQGVSGAVPIPPDKAGKDEVIDSIACNVEAMIKADRKITSLKQLQGHIWRTGFHTKELVGAIYEDVPEAFKRWQASGIKIYIYSSGSREAQRLIFGNTVYGDLRKYLCGFFDTTVGNKREARSYMEISQSVGADKPSQILFVTDVLQEAVAAKTAGFEVLISVRPGNAPLPENHGFPTISSFAEI